MAAFGELGFLPTGGTERRLVATFDAIRSLSALGSLEHPKYMVTRQIH